MISNPFHFSEMMRQRGLHKSHKLKERERERFERLSKAEINLMLRFDWEYTRPWNAGHL